MSQQHLALPEFAKFKTNNLKGYLKCNVCRLCANVSDNVVPIFDKVDEKESIYAKLKKCLPSILVLESDIKPKQICLSCVSKLDSCFSFIEMSLDADFKFEALLQNKLLPQIQIISDDKSTQVETPTWIPIKQECDDTTTKSDDIPATIPVDETKPPQQLCYTDLSILCQQLSFQQQTCESEATLPTVQFQPQTNDIGLLVSKQDSNHNVISSQDLILLVEVNRKGGTNNFVLTSKKAVGVGHDATDDDDCTKITSINDLMNFHTHEKMTNVEGFTDEADVPNKVTLTLEGEDGQNNSEPTAVLKTLDADIMNMLKMEDVNTTNIGLQMESPTEKSQQFNVVSTNEASVVVNVSKAGSIRKSQPSTSEDLHCPVCSRGFSRRNRLNAHVARHSSERPFSCDKCDQRFITRWDLTLHLRIHSGIFTCEFCGKAFPAKGKLERHRRTHTGERPFPCTTCGKAFSEKRNLDNHLKTHSATANNTRKSRVNYANVFLSCGHLGTMSEDGMSKTCLTCDKTTAEEATVAKTTADSENVQKITLESTTTDGNIVLISAAKASLPG